jgi:hypothetical protein
MMEAWEQGELAHPIATAVAQPCAAAMVGCWLKSMRRGCLAQREDHAFKKQASSAQ